MKHIGIACNHYKVSAYKKRLKKKGYKFKVTRSWLFTVIKVEVPDLTPQNIIGKMCDDVETFFKKHRK